MFITYAQRCGFPSGQPSLAGCHDKACIRRVRGRRCSLTKHRDDSPNHLAEEDSRDPCSNRPMLWMHDKVLLLAHSRIRTTELGLQCWGVHMLQDCSQMNDRRWTLLQWHEWHAVSCLRILR
jgi:hypothetical protein